MVQRRPDWSGMIGNQGQPYHSSRSVENVSLPPSSRSKETRSTSPSKVVVRLAVSTPPEQGGEREGEEETDGTGGGVHQGQSPQSITLSE